MKCLPRCCFSFTKTSSSKGEELPLLSQEDRAPIHEKIWGTIKPKEGFQDSKSLLHKFYVKDHSFVLLFEPAKEKQETVACILTPVQEEEKYVSFGDPRLELITPKYALGTASKVFSRACLTLTWKGEDLKATFFGDKQGTIGLKPITVVKSLKTEKVCIVFQTKIQGYERCILGPVHNDHLP